MNTEDVSRVNPPYIPLMTLENFAGKLKAAVVPPVIDSSLTQRMSGGMAGALMSALKFLGLVDADGKTQASLKQLVAAHGTPEWAAMQAQLLLPAYEEIIGDLNLQTTTPAMLEECFKKRTKASGQVLDKAVRFFLAIMTAAELPISPLLKTRKVRPVNSQRRAVRERTRKSVIETNDDDDDQDTGKEEGSLPPGMQQIRLPLLNKGNVILALPDDFNGDDWRFLKPILEAYIDRMLGTDLVK